MIKLKRNQIIITALVVMIAVAGYLNYIDSRSPAASAGIALNDQGEINALIPDTLGMTNAYAEAEIGDAIAFDDNPQIDVAMEQTDTAQDAPMADAAETSGASADNGGGTQPDPGTAVFVNTSSDSSYFVQAKLDREQARSREKDLLAEIINNANIEQAQKAQAADSMLDVVKRIEKETAAEAMIESKGFSEVYVRIDDNSVDVVVNKSALTDAEIAQIEDIVKRKTGMSEDQIHISPMRK